MAITGGIAEGKSTVIEVLRGQGFGAYSSDDSAKDLLSLSEVRGRVASIAGLPLSFTSFDLRRVLYTNHSVRRSLNRYLHPMIAARGKDSDATFFEVPLLVETCQWLGYDQVWVVTSGSDEQKRRLLERYQDERQVATTMARQLDSHAKLAFADAIIRTNQPIEAVRTDLTSMVTAMYDRHDCSAV